MLQMISLLSIDEVTKFQVYFKIYTEIFCISLCYSIYPSLIRTSCGSLFRLSCYDGLASTENISDKRTGIYFRNLQGFRRNVTTDEHGPW